MSDDEKEVMAGCLATLQTLRTHTSPTITMRHLEIVIHIFLHPGITRQELTKQIPAISESSLRRYIKELCKVSWKDSYGGASNMPGYNLISIEESDIDHRVKPLYLTDAGTQMMSSIAKKLQDGMGSSVIQPNVVTHSSDWKH